MSFSVLTVCLGNICRSPTAAAAIRQAAEEAGLVVTVGSAGTGTWHIGQPPHPQAVAAAADVGLQVAGRARRFNVADFEKWDVIAVMDRSNLRDVLDLAPSLEARAKVRLFRTYDPAAEEDEVPDPWGGPEEGYTEMVEIVTASARGLVASLASVGVEDPVAGE